MQKKSPILLITAVLGVLAVGGAALLLMPKGSTPNGASGVAVAAAVPTPTPMAQMRYIASRDIPPRTVITADMMQRTAVSGPMPPGAITSLADVRGMLTSKPIHAGETITSDSLNPRIARVIPANFEVPYGFRAVAIYVDAGQTAAGLVDVGDRVDVMSISKMNLVADPDQRILGSHAPSISRNVATDLLVLAVDKSLQAPVAKPTPIAEQKAPAPAADGAAVPASNVSPPPAGGTAPAEVRPEGGKASDSPEGKIRVLLAAPPETASRLLAAGDAGTLNIVIRNPLDGDTASLPEIREIPGEVVYKPQARQVSTGGGPMPAMPAMPMPELPPVTMSQTSSVPPAPLPMVVAPGPSQIPSNPQPAAPPTSEVMVVRGTEKVRVIVPQR